MQHAKSRNDLLNSSADLQAKHTILAFYALAFLQIHRAQGDAKAATCVAALLGSLQAARNTLQSKAFKTTHLMPGTSCFPLSPRLLRIQCLAP